MRWNLFLCVNDDPANFKEVCIGRDLVSEVASAAVAGLESLGEYDFRAEQSNFSSERW